MFRILRGGWDVVGLAGASLECCGGWSGLISGLTLDGSRCAEGWVECALGSGWVRELEWAEEY